MTIEFICSSCSTTLRVPKEHLGKQARCPKCSNLNVVQPGQKVAPPSSYPAGPNGPDGQASANPYQVGQGTVLPAHGMTPGNYQKAHRGGLVLALGIIAICCNIAAVPGILAWIFGKSDLKAMDAGLMDPEGRGMTQAGMIMGLVRASSR